jgi:hypothetical protein
MHRNICLLLFVLPDKYCGQFHCISQVNVPHLPIELTGFVLFLPPEVHSSQHCITAGNCRKAGASLSTAVGF